MVEVEDIRKALTGLEIVFRAIKASGGHRFREQFQATDHEMRETVENSEAQIRTVVVESMVARDLLKEHGHEEEFERRLEELGKRMTAELKA